MLFCGGQGVSNNTNVVNVFNLTLKNIDIELITAVYCIVSSFQLRYMIIINYNVMIYDCVWFKTTWNIYRSVGKHAVHKIFVYFI